MYLVPPSLSMAGVRRTVCVGGIQFFLGPLLTYRWHSEAFWWEWHELSKGCAALLGTARPLMRWEWSLEACRSVGCQRERAQQSSPFCLHTKKLGAREGKGLGPPSVASWYRGRTRTPGPGSCPQLSPTSWQLSGDVFPGPFLWGGCAQRGRIRVDD